jgi:hypothetical protein
MSNMNIFIFDTDQAQIYSAEQMLNKPAFVDRWSNISFHLLLTYNEGKRWTLIIRTDNGVMDEWTIKTPNP